MGVKFWPTLWVRCKFIFYLFIFLHNLAPNFRRSLVLMTVLANVTKQTPDLSDNIIYFHYLCETVFMALQFLSESQTRSLHKSQRVQLHLYGRCHAVIIINTTYYDRHTSATKSLELFQTWTVYSHVQTMYNKLQKYVPKRHEYIGWQWRNFFISYLCQLFLRRVVGQALQNVSYSDITFFVR